MWDLFVAFSIERERDLTGIITRLAVKCFEGEITFGVSKRESITTTQ